MAFKLVIKPIVWFDLEEAIDWYEKESKGLGKRFYTSFEDAVQKILSHPKAYKSINRKVKRIIMKNFPYKILYTISNNNIYIIGVMHAQISNASIRRRLKSL